MLDPWVYRRFKFTIDWLMNRLIDWFIDRRREQRRFPGLGYEAHLVETLEKDLLVKNPDVKWNDVAG